MTAQWETIAELVRARGRERPDDLAFEIVGREMSYSQVDEASDRIAASFAARGIAKGDRVVSFAYNCVEQVLTWFGCMKLGVTWIPLNVGLLGEDLAYCLRDTNPSLVVVDAENLPKLGDIGDRVPQFPVVLIGGQGGAADGPEPFDALLEPGDVVPDVEIGPGDPAVVIYTGGTTGMPKGVLLPQFAWIAAGQRYIETFDVGTGDRHYSVCPLFHNSGLMLGLIGPYVAGIPTHMERWFSVSRFWERVRSTGATILDPIGTMVTLLCQQPASDQDRNHRARVAIGVLAQVPEGVGQTFRERFGIETVNVYSLSESGGVLMVHNSIGSPKPEANGNGGERCDIAILDRNDRPLATGAVGEICLRPKRSFTFMLGYLNHPERTLECWRNLWLHTGDLGYVDEDGYLYFVGRHAHWLRVNGENVSAYEVENLLSAYPGLDEVIVIGVPSELGEESVKAFVRSGAVVDPAELYRWALPRMATFKLPRFIEQVDEFPRSVTKREVERHKLRDLSNDAAWDAHKVFGRPGRAGQMLERRGRPA